MSVPFSVQDLPAAFYDATMDWRVPIAFAALYVLGTHLASPASNPPPSKGPKKSSPWDPMKVIILLHNIILAAYSAYTFYHSFAIIREDFFARGFTSMHCDTDFQRWKNPNWEVLSWMFYISKYYEIIDTIIVILKNRRPIFLQTFHHAGAIILMFWLIKSQHPTVYLFVILNSFIHSLMYTYYSLTVLGMNPSWKVMMTSLQLIQFIVGNAIASVSFLLDGCLDQYRNIILVSVIAYTTALIYLFSQFFKSNYSSKPKRS